MLKPYSADLHIHSCLSPCGDLDMTPRNIVAVAVSRGLDIIAVTDHNASENTSPALKAARNSRLSVLSGMEVASEEEAHLLVLFDQADRLLRFQEVVYEHLAVHGADRRTVEDQVIVNEKDQVEGFNHHLLLGATTLSFQRLVDEAHRLGGLAIASHVDRESFSIIGQLGFIPDSLRLDALEISPFTDPEGARARFPDAARFPLVTFSDAHYAADIGRRTTRFFIARPAVAEIKMALNGSRGRKII